MAQFCYCTKLAVITISKQKYSKTVEVVRKMVWLPIYRIVEKISYKPLYFMASYRLIFFTITTYIFCALMTKYYTKHRSLFCTKDRLKVITFFHQFESYSRTFLFRQWITFCVKGIQSTAINMEYAVFKSLIHYFWSYLEAMIE